MGTDPDYTGVNIRLKKRDVKSRRDRSVLDCLIQGTTASRNGRDRALISTQGRPPRTLAFGSGESARIGAVPGTFKMNGTLDLAQTLHLQGRLSEAETHYREVLHWHPDAVEALRGLGALAYQHGRVDEAMALFARGVTIRPEAADFHANLAEALRILKRTDEAVEHARRALALDSTMPDAWNTMGLLAHEQKRFTDAESAYREAIRLQPRHTSAHINLGSTLQARGRLEEAAESLRRANWLEPDNAAALTNLGQVLIEMGNLDLLGEAEVLCRRALAVAPELTQAINSLGNVLRLQGRFEDAMSCYRRTLHLILSRRRPVTTSANCFSSSEGTTKLPNGLTGRKSSRMTRRDTNANHGSLWAARERYHESARCYRLALAHDPELAEAHQGLGAALLELGSLDEAETCFREAMRIDPSLPSPWVSQARLLAERGEFELSCDAARQALARRPELADAWMQLACNLKGRLPATDVQAMEDLLNQRYLSDDSRSLLLFGLAGVFDAQGDYAGPPRDSRAPTGCRRWPGPPEVNGRTPTSTRVSSTGSSLRSHLN